MEGYGYTYPPPFPQMRLPSGEYPDHGDGIGEYYTPGPQNEDREIKRRSRSKQRKNKERRSKNSRSRSRTVSKSRSQSQTQTRSQSHSRSLTRTRSRSRTRSVSGSRKELNLKEPGFLDAFRVLYLTPSKHKKSATKYLATKKRQDRVQEVLKRDGLGSKRWLFYPRVQKQDSTLDEVPGARDNCDQRVKVDGEFFRKYKKSKRVDSDAPIAKLKRWELVFYKKLGFIQAV